MTHPDDPGRDLERVVAAHLAEWESAHVELAIHGHADAAAVVRALDEFCRGEHGAAVARALFYESSIGAVAGLELDDGRRVVVKAHTPDWSRARLEEVVRLQGHLAALGRFAPTVVAGPSPLGRGLAIAEAYVARGVTRDPHRPAIRRALAASLHSVVEALAPFAGASVLPSQLLSSPSPERLWPTPHSRLFDFQATRVGAEDIDDLAAEARTRMTPAGRVVLGHGDWRAQHVRFEDLEPVVAFDWDSLCREPEPALVGFAAHAFCADWSRSDHVQAPSFDEARAFVAEYEAARGSRFAASISAPGTYPGCHNDHLGPLPQDLVLPDAPSFQGVGAGGLARSPPEPGRRAASAVPGRTLGRHRATAGAPRGRRVREHHRDRRGHVHRPPPGRLHRDRDRGARDPQEGHQRPRPLRDGNRFVAVHLDVNDSGTAAAPVLMIASD